MNIEQKYTEVASARALAIRLGIIWHSAASDNEKLAKFPEYYQAWLKYQAMDLALAKMEIEVI